MVVYFCLGCDRILTWHILIETIGKMIKEVMVTGEILATGEIGVVGVVREEIEGCTQQYVTSVGGNAKCLLGLMEVSLYIALVVLRKNKTISDRVGIIMVAEINHLMIEVVAKGRIKIKITKFWPQSIQNWHKFWN